MTFLFQPCDEEWVNWWEEGTPNIPNLDPFVPHINALELLALELSVQTLVRVTQQAVDYAREVERERLQEAAEYEAMQARRLTEPHPHTRDYPAPGLSLTGTGPWVPKGPWVPRAPWDPMELHGGHSQQLPSNFPSTSAQKQKKY